MEQVLEFIAENIVSITTSAAIIVCYIFGKPETAEKIKKKKEKELKRTHKKAVKLVTALDKTNKKEETLKKEIEENASK